MNDYPEIEICSRCKDNTVFEQDPDTGEWLSVCCSAYAVNLDEDYDLGYLEVDDLLDDPYDSDSGAPEDDLPF